MASIKDKMKNAAIKTAITTALNYLEKNPEENALKVMDLVDKFSPDDWYVSQRKMVREVLEAKGNWYELMLKVYALDPGVRKAFFENFMVNASLTGSARQHEIQEKYNCNVPWAILMDPTAACNLRCTGCWAAQYGYNLNLSFDDLDSIITQGKELGTYMYIYTGGEPTVRKDDLFKICEKHPDCEFLSFTNGTLIDQEFCDNMLRVKNFVPAISLEGFEEANDGRRGEGVFDKVMNAMTLLKKNRLPFGLSICYTSKNYKDVTSEKFYDMIIDMGALFVWFFHYMPVGKGASPELMLNPEQRKEMYDKVRGYRQTKAIFGMDFQNDGEFVGGCIAGGRRYFHINAKGDCEPCVFIHYSNVNIHDTSLLDVLRSPLFQAYHDNQPFNDNMMRPCPMLENSGALTELVNATGAVNTDYTNPESAEELCAKTAQYAENWKPMADQIWEDRQEWKKANGKC